MKPNLMLPRVFAYTFVVFLAILCIFPFYISVINATRSATEINTRIRLLPGFSAGENIAELFRRVNLLRGFLNSTIISLSTILLSCYFGAAAAYGLAMFSFRGKTFCLALVLLTLLVPPQVGLVGFVEMLNKVELVDTYWPLILPGIANSFVIFFLKQYMETSLNSAYLEAARIDGGSELYIFHHIILPMIMPGLATMAVLVFIGSWNNYLLPLTILFSQENFTLPILISQLTATTYRTNWGSVYMASTLSFLPILLMFLVFSRRMMDSVSLGGSKE
ncbi:MAG: carbohydrate ABC transporter permease [Spirochaetota bacterium]